MQSRDINLFLASAVALGLALGGPAWAGAAPPAPGGAAPAQPRPNILFVAIDDLNDWGVTALNGRPGVHTPNLDRLAARGMLFLNAHCAAPACNPSRTSVLTGIAPHSSGVYNNSSDWRANERLKAVTTLPNYFRQHGYTACGAGKLFHSLEWHDGPTDGYNDPGSWDTYFPSFQRQMPHRVLPADPPLARGAGARPPNFFDWGPIQKPMESMPDHQVIDWSIAELGKPHAKPFFQAVGIFRPHIPWYVPKQFFDLYPLDQIKLPYVKPGWREPLPPAAQRSGQARRQWHQWILNNQAWTNAVQGYLASISFADYQLGRLLDALDRSPEKDHTIVMLWTDHGFHVGDKATWEKFTLWAESTRVPCIVVAPGVTRPGSQCARAVSLLDLYPTLVELAGLPPCDKNQGVSLVPWLRDPVRPKERPAVITNGRGNHAVRDDRWHYIRYANGDEELYDMTGDDGQWDNRAADPKCADLKTRLAQWLPKDDAPDQGPTRGGLEGPPLNPSAGLRLGGDGAIPAAKPATYPIQAAPATAVRFSPDNKFITPVNDPEYRPQQFYYTDAISDNAVKFMQDHAREHSQQPLFLYVAYTCAHWPMHAPEAALAKTRGRYDAGYDVIRQARFKRARELGVLDPRWAMSPAAGDWDQVKNKAWEIQCMEVYAAMVECMDRGLGRMIAELKRQGQLDNTLLLYLEDNGGCAEGFGRGSNADAAKNQVGHVMGPDELQTNTGPINPRNGSSTTWTRTERNSTISPLTSRRS